MDASTFKPVDLSALSMDALEPLHALLDPDLTDSQREIAEVIFVGLTNSPAAQVMAPPVIAAAAVAVLFQIGHVLGGRAYYIQTFGGLRAARMSRAIRANFNGRNHLQLAREHGITDMRVRQILNPPKPKKGRES